MATTQTVQEPKDTFPKKVTVGTEPIRILLADSERKPLIIRRLDPKCKLTFNQIASGDGNSQETSLSGSGAVTQLDGSYKGEVWASASSGEIVLKIEEVEE